MASSLEKSDGGNNQQAPYVLMGPYESISKSDISKDLLSQLTALGYTPEFDPLCSYLTSKGKAVIPSCYLHPGNCNRLLQALCDSLEFLRKSGIDVPFSFDRFVTNGTGIIVPSVLIGFVDWLKGHKDLIKYLPILKEFGISAVLNFSTGKSFVDCGDRYLYIGPEYAENLRVFAVFAYLLKQRPFVQLPNVEKFWSSDKLSIADLEKIVE